MRLRGDYRFGLTGMQLAFSLCLTLLANLHFLVPIVLAGEIIRPPGHAGDLEWPRQHALYLAGIGYFVLFQASRTYFFAGVDMFTVYLLIFLAGSPVHNSLEDFRSLLVILGCLDIDAASPLYDEKPIEGSHRQSKMQTAGLIPIDSPRSGFEMALQTLRDLQSGADVETSAGPEGIWPFFLRRTRDLVEATLSKCMLYLKC